MYYKNVCIIHSAPPPSYLHIAPHHIWTMHCTNGIPPNEIFQKRTIIANIVVMRMIFTSYQGLSIDYVVNFEGLGRSAPLCVVQSVLCNKSFLLNPHVHCIALHIVRSVSRRAAGYTCSAVCQLRVPSTPAASQNSCENSINCGGFPLHTPSVISLRYHSRP